MEKVTYIKTGAVKARKRTDNSCSICDSKNVNTGIIFRGLCVCEDCVKYVAALPDAAESDAKAGSGDVA